MDETELTEDEVNDLLDGSEREPDGTRTTSTSGSGDRAGGPVTVTAEAATG